MLSNVLSSSVALAAPAEQSRIDWRRIAQTILLVLLPCACYWPALNGAFLWDDDILVSENRLVRAADGLRSIWFSTAPLDYFPLTNSAFWLQWRLWGNDPLGYHLVNLALHVASSFLLWRLLRALRVPGAWFGAVLFAVHPVNVASVAWIAECKSVLSMVFYLASLLCYVRWESDVESRKLGRYAAAAGFYALALLSKSAVVMMPCVLLVLAWWRTGRVGWRDVVRTIPFFALSLAAGLATLWFQYHHSVSAESLSHANPLPVRLIVAGRTILFYLGKLFWPQRLAMIYPRWTFPAGDVAGFVWPAALAALFGGAWWGRRRWGRAPAAALASFVVILLPVCGLAHMAYFSFSYVSDHLVYAATPGVLALVAAGLTRWYERGGIGGRVALAVISGVAGLLSVTCLERADDFSGPEKLWTANLEVNPQAFAAHTNLGVVLQHRGLSHPALFPVAEAHFRAALRINSQYANAGLCLADLLRVEGRWTEAAEAYRQALAKRADAEGLNNYGVTLLELADYAGAREAFQQATRLRPDMASVYYNLYGLELAQDHLPEACALLRTCLRINPDDVQALTSLLALTLERPGQPALSLPAAEMALALAERACHLTNYRGARQLILQASAALAAGRRGEAAASAHRAHDAALASGENDLLGAIEGFQRSLAP